MRHYYILGIISFFFTSCGHNSHEANKIDSNSAPATNDTLFFTTLLEPSFSEVSSIELIKVDTTYNLSILINKDFRKGNSQDTFYYKVVKLTKNQFTKIDTTLIQKIRIKFPEKSQLGFDGMSISFKIIDKGDTSKLGFWSPGKDTEPNGYNLTKAAIDNFKNAFNDQIINDYFDDVETYIDNSKITVFSKKNRLINALRARTYSR